MPDEITPPESREQAAEKHRDELEPEDRVRPELAESLRRPPERRHLLRSPRRLSRHPVVALPREDRDHRARERRESADRFRACRPRTASNQDDREDPDHRDCGLREHRRSHEGPSSYRERHRGRRLAREPQRGAEREATRQRHQGVIAHAVEAPPRHDGDEERHSDGERRRLGEGEARGRRRHHHGHGRQQHVEKTGPVEERPTRDPERPPQPMPGAGDRVIQRRLDRLVVDAIPLAHPPRHRGRPHGGRRRPHRWRHAIRRNRIQVFRTTVQKEGAGARARDARAVEDDGFTDLGIQRLIAEPNRNMAARVLDDQVVVERLVEGVERRQCRGERPDPQSCQQTEQRQPHARPVGIRLRHGFQRFVILKNHGMPRSSRCSNSIA